MQRGLISFLKTKSALNVISAFLATAFGSTCAFGEGALAPQTKRDLIESISNGDAVYATSAVVRLIVEHPDQARQIVREAIEFAPQWSTEITTSAAAAFPGFADQITASATGTSSDVLSGTDQQPKARKAHERKNWSMTVFSGALSVSDTSDIYLASGEFEESGVVGIAVAKQFATTSQNLAWEIEFQTSKHIGAQDHWEFVGVILARWSSFPWNDHVRTTFAIGDGLSYATEVPSLEKSTRDDSSTDLLNFLFAEITLAPPDHPDIALSLRYHHRSGMFGTFDGVKDASTVFALGLKYYF